jgi:hypothetical protein
VTRRLAAAIELDVPAAACWQAFLRLEDWPRWFPTMQRLERAAATPPFTVGEELVLHLAFRGRGAPVRVRVLEVSPTHVRWSGRSFGVTGDHSYRVESLGERRCRFLSEEIFSGLPVRLIPRFVFAELQREHDVGMERFRRLAEA